MCEGATISCEAEMMAHPRYHQIAHRDYDKALRSASRSRRRRSQSHALLSLAQILEAGQESFDLGIQEVEVAAIVGSSGRYRDYDGGFAPTRRENNDRWVNVAQAHYEGISLPPVNLYRFGETYFVEDGNHRVSVARILGHSTLKAKVLEIRIPERSESFE